MPCRTLNIWVSDGSHRLLSEEFALPGSWLLGGGVELEEELAERSEARCSELLDDGQPDPGWHTHITDSEAANFP